MNSNQIYGMIRHTIDDYKLKKINLDIFIGIMRSYYPVINAMRTISMDRSTNKQYLINYINSEIETAKTLDGTWISNDENRCCATCAYSYELLNDGLTGCNVKSGRLLPSERVCCLWLDKVICKEGRVI